MAPEGTSRSDTLDVATIIVNYRTPGLALRSAESLGAERANLPGLRAVIVDGGSGDDSPGILSAGIAEPGLAGWVELLALDLNGGFGWANNQAILRLLDGPRPPDFIHLLNPDAQIEQGALVRLVEAMQADPRIGAVGSQLFAPDGSPAGSAFRFPSPGREFVRAARTRALERLFAIEPVAMTPAGSGPVDWVTGASVLLRTAALRDTGLFDTGFFLYFEELELMWRMRRAGWEVRHEAASRVRHVGGAATGVSYGRESARFAPRLPPYMFDSRRRMLALTRGRAGALAANLAWLSGHLIFSIRRALGLASDHVPVSTEAQDLIRAGLWPKARDLVSSPSRAGDPIDEPPVWMHLANRSDPDAIRRGA